MALLDRRTSRQGVVCEDVQLDSVVIGRVPLPTCSEHRIGLRIFDPRKAGNVLTDWGTRSAYKGGVNYDSYKLCNLLCDLQNVYCKVIGCLQATRSPADTFTSQSSHCPVPFFFLYRFLVVHFYPGDDKKSKAFAQALRIIIHIFHWAKSENIT